MRQVNNTALSREDMLRKAPSIFAEAPSAKTTSKYMFVPTIQVVEQIEKQGFTVVQAGQSRSRKEDGTDYAKHMIRFRRNEHVGLQIEEVDKSVPELVLFNSHNGLSSFQLNLGLYRLVCSNGLIVGDTLASESVKHVGYNHDKIIDAQYRVLSNETKLIETSQAMQQIELTQPERLLLAESALQVRYASEDTKPEPIKLLSPRRYADQKTDLWTTFNVIQENMIRGGVRTITRDEQGRAIRRNSTRAVNSVSENKRLNQALWTLAEEMKKLKVGA